MNGRRDHGRSGAAARAALLGCLLAVVSLFCCSWVAAGSGPAPDATAANHAGGSGQDDRSPDGHGDRDRSGGHRDRPDGDRGGSACHGEEHGKAQVLLPHAPSVPAAPAPSHATGRTAGGEGIRGPSHDAAPSVDLHRLQVQRT